MKVLLVLCLMTSALASVRFPNLKKSPTLNKPLLQDVGEPLILTPYLEANKIQEAREAAQVNLEAFKNVSSYSGFLTVDKEKNGNLFFWFFKSENNYEEDPVLVWLQGGPGGTSLYGLFVEIGPFGVANGTVVSRDFSWHKTHSVLYIDNPVGTGFSFTDGDYVTDQNQVGDHLYKFLTQFFTMFPEIQKNEFYVSGESYAGKYLPAIGHFIHKNNPTASVKINLKGLLICNGLSDPRHQSNYAALLYQLGLIDKNAADQYENYQSLLFQSIDMGIYEFANECLDQLIGTLFDKYTALRNIYNFASDVDDSPTEWQDFVQTAEIRKALHVGNQTFNYQSDPVYESLSNDKPKSVAPWVSELLSHYRILVFNGQLDIIVAYSLTAEYLQNLNFSSSAEYAKAEREIWTVSNRVAGYVKNAGNLTEVMVRDAGHMVPKDQPEAAYDLVYKFIRGQPISSK
ncbi:unnamed protein product [Ceutorhynchus assimilis]|uniref:Carboxypeptidase n=1 Tax=Ceutorhynchus assimilis TaxID=467358 RepID=A0A9N9QJ45_9CUCU|nr:unnamed protein product [Ceutorhynchus assimilis]